MKNRIQKFIEYKGMSPGDLATVLDVQRSNISHILNGRNKPGAHFIEKFLNVFPEIDARWFLTGKGEMISSKNHSDDSTSSSKNEIKSEHEIIYSNKINRESAERKVINVILLFSDGTFSNFLPGR